MKASEFIKLLEDEIQKEGDLEVVIRSGTMEDPEFVSEVEVCLADVTPYGKHRSIWIPSTYGTNPKIPNSKLFMINSGW